MAEKIRKGDKVMVVCGPIKGSIGVVEKVLKNDRMIISNGEIGIRHIKKRNNEPGRFDEFTKSIHKSNLAHVDSNDRQTKVYFGFDEQGKKCLISRSENKEIRKV